MASIAEDIDTASDWIANALISSGYVADFQPGSLWEIDRFFDENSTNGKAIKGGLLSEDLGQRIFAIGSYIGEVLRRNIGGQWHGDDNDPEAEFNVELRLPTGAVCWPIQRAMKRFKMGSTEGIAEYGSAMGLNVGERPPKKKSWWNFW
jgi:hypothetical protein